MKKDVFLLLGFLLVISLFLISCTITGGSVYDDECRSLQNLARDDCYFEKMKCSQIDNLNLRDSCVAELAKTKKDLAVCELIQTEKIQAYCLEQIAELTNDPAICEEITDNYWRDNCYFYMGVDNNQGNYCASIGNTEQESTCYENVALATNNHLLCGNLEGERKKGCIYAIAANMQDVSLCKTFEARLAQNACALKVAKVSDDKTICEELNIAYIKDLCYEHFGSSSEN